MLFLDWSTITTPPTTGKMPVGPTGETPVLLLLFKAESDDGVDFEGASRREIAGRERGGSE